MLADDGIVVAKLAAMAPVIGEDRTPLQETVESIDIVRWVLLRGSSAVTCDVRFNGLRSYDVCVLPHWTRSMSVIEHYESLSSALRRHGDIAGRFQRDGWVLAHESTPAAGVAA